MPTTPHPKRAPRRARLALARPALALLALALVGPPRFAEDAKRAPPPPTPTEEPAPAPTPAPVPAPAPSPASEGTRDDTPGGTPRAPVEDEALELGAAPAGRAPEVDPELARVHGVALPAHLAPSGARVRRDALEGALERYASFDELPGGVVFGRAALPPEGAQGPWRLRRDGARLLLAGVDRTLALPAERPAVLRAALRFAASERGSDTLIDVDALGEIHLAPELLDTEAGMIAYVADVLPRERLAGTRGSKSLLVDLSTRLAVRDGSLALEPALELRFYVPSTEDEPGSEPERKRTLRFVGAPLRAEAGDDGAELPWDEEELSALAAELAPAARLAGWIAFFRWARAAAVPGLDELESTLAGVPDATVTPRRIVPGRLR